MSITETSKLVGNKLLDLYKLGDYFLASPNQTIRGRGIFAKVEAETLRKSTNLAETVQTTIHRAKKDGHPKPVVIGVFPFDPDEQVHLVVPNEMKIASKLDWCDVEEEANALSSYSVQEIPEPDIYMDGVNKGLELIDSGELEKIVLSRSLDIKSKEPIQIKPILTKLARHNTQGYTFSIDLPNDKSNGHRTLIGASPELLVSKSGRIVIANPLAGSRPRSEDPMEDQRRANELLNSTKDLHEHAIVVHAVEEALQPLCDKLDIPKKPTLIQTETMWHLSTEIKGTVKEANTSSLALASALHPTPAVCGYPATVAHQAIRNIEAFERGYFTGMVGWCDEHGDGEWVITIRCAEVCDHSIRLFAGAGVVAGSKAEEELAETGAKFQTILKAMGIHNR
ncbi:isochorismate synthase DhbC [Aquibacillus rhizosphaerae]|uniref:isochorismate synthase n=1 Tax=Aquibacillus rhizosphaerae TaxID=3051431 RepID=A0ABT7L3T6_9BACI|nr:isochorismate synthase DhbC [Aquibacillus sp. LR5S19]MDL4840527.1 isochorismate synthase DhbC [Aquibacillus sp. LR5S19]